MDINLMVRDRERIIIRSKIKVIHSASTGPSSIPFKISDSFNYCNNSERKLFVAYQKDEPNNRQPEKLDS